MKNSEESDWLEGIIHRHEGYEAVAIREFTERLLRLAGSRLPPRLQQRVDPEDIVQSVFKSFFARHNAGRFTFEQTADVWRLLAAITWHKTQHSIRHHHQQERDVQKEAAGSPLALLQPSGEPTASSVMVMMELLDQIMERIPPKHREILRLRLEDFSIDEIAQAVGVSSRTVDRALALVRQVALDLFEAKTI